MQIGRGSAMNLSSKLHSTLQSIFAGELYPVVHPDPDGTMGEVAGTYAIFTIVGGASFNKLDGDSDMNRPRVQVSIYSINYDDLKVKESAVASAMQASNALANVAIGNKIDPLTLDTCIVNVSVSVPTEGYESDTKRFYSHSDYYCWSRS